MAEKTKVVAFTLPAEEHQLLKTAFYREGRSIKEGMADLVHKYILKTNKSNIQK